MENITDKLETASPSRGDHDLRFRRKLEFATKDVTATAWNISGLGEVSMNQVWEWVCIMTAEKHNLKEICDVPGAPSIRTLFHWRRKYPTFDQRLREAEQIRAYLIAEEATDAGRGATPETAQAAKVAFQALTWRAAKLDPSAFADKRIEEHRHDFSDTATEELKGRVAAMVSAFPHLLGIAKEALGSKIESPKVIDITPEPKEEPPPP